MEIGTTADAFQPIDGGAGRACRGANQTDTQPAYYINYNPSEVPTLAACKAMCSGTADCRGIQFSIYGCQIWTRPEGIENTAISPDLTCLRYSPFRLAGGFPGRSCRGNDSTDNAPSNFEWSQVASISACQKNCLDTPECAGIDYDDRTSGCKVWTRSILASVKSNDVTCMRYEPFLAADGGVDRSCRGAGVTDEWPSYYVVHNHTWSTGPSIDECKERCLAMPGCRGLEYTKASCKVWTNPIQSTALQQGSLCLRFGSFDPYELLDAFVAVHGGQDRACRGSNSSDIDASYYTSVGPARAGTLEACKALCMRTSGCNAIQFSLSECQLWTGSQGVEATALTEGVQCLRLQPFRDFDGRQDRLCQSLSQPDSATVGTLEECQQLCSEAVKCTGINFNNEICQVFTGEFSSISSPGSRCSSFQPFISVDGGVDRDCRGSHEDDVHTSHYVIADAITLEDCKMQCIFHSMCKGIAFSSGNCKLWTRTRGIQASKFALGYVCLQLGVTDPLYDMSVSAFKLIDGGYSRACRGQDVFDNLDSHFTVHLSWPENSSIEACQSLCMQTPSCKGIEFRSGACEVWTLPGGIQATVPSTGRACFRYEPFQSLDGFDDRVCRGSNMADSQASYYNIYPPSETPTVESCKELCIQNRQCKGIEYRGWCEIWTRPQGIGAVAPSPGSQCLQYRPFMTVEGGTNRECRGAGPSDKWSNYFVSHEMSEDATLEDCKSLCVRAGNCKGVTFRAGNCEVWTRRGGIQGSAYSSGSLCLRLGPADVWEDSHAFRPLSGASLGYGACHAPGMSFRAYGPEAAPSLQECKLKCMSTPLCRGVGFNSSCFLFLGFGSLSAVPDADSTCLSYEPFRDVDGGAGRDCRGSRNDDLQSAYFVELPAASVQACQDLCVLQAEGDVVGRPCKGIAYDSATQTCRLWVRTQGIGATVEMTSSICQRYEPFLDLDGGSGRACRGAHSLDILPHFVEYSPAQAPNLDACRSLCINTPGCTGQGHLSLWA